MNMIQHVKTLKLLKKKQKLLKLFLTNIVQDMVQMELLNTKDIMEEFDQEVFNALIDYVIVGGYDENGVKDQYLIMLILKTRI